MSAAAEHDLEGIKKTSRQVIEARAAELIALSESIHSDPELCFEERRSAAKVADSLADAGFDVESGICDLETAFRATSGSGQLHIVICAEYDALAGVGHACGHNLIAASAVGAGIGLASIADEVGLTVTVMGTPAEEGGGGKVLLLDRGAFDSAHAAMMVHPWPSDILAATCLAVDHVEVLYEGRRAHASAAPWEGINAADATVIAQTAIGLLRQQLRPGDQVHGIVDYGGEAPNIVPHRAHGTWMMRSLTREGLASLRPRIERCFEAGALATGSHLTISDLSPTYSHFEVDVDLLSVWKHNAEALGRRYPEETSSGAAPPPTLSTDMANVSLALPAIHPMVGVESHGAVNHQAEFAAACVGPSAEKALFDGATAMAWTAVDAATQPALRARLLARSGS